MFRFLAFLTALSFGLAGTANANQPLALNLKLKIDGAVDRVDMGVWANCTVTQGSRFGVSSASGSIQILKPGETFVTNSSDGTKSVTLNLDEDNTINPDGRPANIRCYLFKGTAEDLTSNYMDTDKLFLRNDELRSPVGPGSCPSVSFKYDFSNNVNTDIQPECK